MLARQPIEQAAFNVVLTRVCFKLIELDYRRNPTAYQPHAFTRVHALALEIRQGACPGLTWTLLAAAKWLALGYSLQEWREWYPYQPIGRARHKQRPSLQAHPRSTSRGVRPSHD